MEGLLIYKGKYGATRQYAQWLGESLQIPVMAAGDCGPSDLGGKDFLVLGTSVYIGKLQLAKWLRRNLPLLRNKKLFFFLVAATPPNEKDKLYSHIIKDVPGEIRRSMQVFYLHGKMIMKELSRMDRFLLKMGARMVKDPVQRKNMLTDFNAVKKENIEPIVTAVKKAILLPDAITP